MRKDLHLRRHHPRKCRRASSPAGVLGLPWPAGRNPTEHDAWISSIPKNGACWRTACAAWWNRHGPSHQRRARQAAAHRTGRPGRAGTGRAGAEHRAGFRRVRQVPASCCRAPWSWGAGWCPTRHPSAVMGAAMVDACGDEARARWQPPIRDGRGHRQRGLPEPGRAATTRIRRIAGPLRPPRLAAGWRQAPGLAWRRGLGLAGERAGRRWRRAAAGRARRHGRRAADGHAHPGWRAAPAWTWTAPWCRPTPC